MPHCLSQNIVLFFLIRSRKIGLFCFHVNDVLVRLDFVSSVNEHNLKCLDKQFFLLLCHLLENHRSEKVSIRHLFFDVLVHSVVLILGVEPALRRVSLNGGALEELITVHRGHLVNVGLNFVQPVFAGSAGQSGWLFEHIGVPLCHARQLQVHGSTLQRHVPQIGLA